ncbi:hypothetical protein [Roseospira visakhapatnamensis]|uniref:Uncharacterized protein n=1 Tax=Roseospira visakhapatnamensis TaxID=390880 RepID=A0A7W6W8N2_9PROT|nr:hypothetical protein [Roseospira visakhapatnamensis]MBB4265190.1 hypothetical protein [Roseospira visakhapatnamensis]
MDAPAGRLAMWESDTALTALYDYPDTVAALCTHSQTTRGGAGSGSHTFEPRGTKVILLRRWYSGNEYDRFRWTRTGGDLPGYGTWAKRRDGANNPTSDDSQADFVYACDGLQRTGSNNNRTLYVRYIRV